MFFIRQPHKCILAAYSKTFQRSEDIFLMHSLHILLSLLMTDKVNFNIDLHVNNFNLMLT